MQVVYNKIRYKNFLSFGKHFTEIDLLSYKKTVINGINGGGKSSILCAITFALFGKPFRNINKPNIVNSINKKDCVVEIEFTVNNKEYKVIRGIKPAIFEIYQDGILLNQDAASKDYQEYLEKHIIGTNYKSFIQVVILGSARYVPFMSLPAADRRAVIEDLLDIQIFSSMNTLVKERLSILKSNLTDTSYKLELVQEKIKHQQSVLEDNTKEKESVISKKEDNIQHYLTENNKHSSEISILQTSIEELTQQIIDKTNLETKKQKLLVVETKANDSIKKLNKQIEFYSHNDNCPTCKQIIATEFKEQKLHDAEDKKIKYNEGLIKLENDLLEINNKLDDIKTIATTIREKQTEVTKLNATIKSNEIFVKQLKKEIEELKNKTNTTIDNNLTELTNELKSLQEEHSKLTEDEKYLKYSATLLKDGGIKTKIIKQYLPVLNNLINKYLSKFQFFVNFTINEKFEEVIKSRHRDAFVYNSFSEGQKTKIDLSILLAFRELSKLKNSVNCNLLLLDEIIDSSLDNDSIELFLDLLDELDYNTNIFVISPKAENLQDRFDRVLKAEMTKNFSKIKEIS